MVWMNPPWPPPTRCGLNLLYAMACRWTPRRSCTCYLNWHTEAVPTVERIRVMRTSNWMVAAFLLITLSAVAQQTAGQSSSVPTAAPQQAAPEAPQPAADPAPAQTSANAAPSTLDQVVDRAVAREHALIQMLANRTPLVETYLQNLKNDSQLGPVPSGDHYYFGRLDM